MGKAVATDHLAALISEQVTPAVEAVLKGQHAVLVHLAAAPSARLTALEGDALSRVASVLFARASAATWLVSVSVLQICDGAACDLLNPDDDIAPPSLAVLPHVGCVLEGAVEIVANNATEAAFLWRSGLQVATLLPPGKDANLHTAVIFTVVPKAGAGSWRARLAVVELQDQERGTAKAASPVIASVQWLQPLLSESATWCSVGVDKAGPSATASRCLGVSLGSFPPRSPLPAAPTHSALLAALRTKLKDAIQTQDSKEQMAISQQLSKELSIAKQSDPVSRVAASEDAKVRCKATLKRRGLMEHQSGPVDTAAIEKDIADMQAEKKRLAVLYRQQKKTVDDATSGLRSLIDTFTKEEASLDPATHEKRTVAIRAGKEDLRAASEQLKALESQLKTLGDQHRDAQTRLERANTGDLDSTDFHREAALASVDTFRQEHAAALARAVQQAREVAEEDRRQAAARHAADTGAPQMMLNAELALIDVRAEKAVLVARLAGAEAEAAHVGGVLNQTLGLLQAYAVQQQQRYLAAFQDFRAQTKAEAARVQGGQRAALDSAVADAVTLAARNADLEAENKRLREELAALRRK